MAKQRTGWYDVEGRKLRKCYYCHEIKDLNEENFYPTPKLPRGFNYICRPCNKIRRKKNYEQTREHELAVNAQWREDNREYDRIRNRMANKRDYAKKMVATKRWRVSNPGWQEAHDAVKRAVKKGVLVRTGACNWCQRTDLTTLFHHYDGYENKLTVIEICASCHKKEHFRLAAEAQMVEAKS